MGNLLVECNSFPCGPIPPAFSLSRSCVSRCATPICADARARGKDRIQQLGARRKDCVLHMSGKWPLAKIQAEKTIKAFQEAPKGKNCVTYLGSVCLMLWC